MPQIFLQSLRGNATDRDSSRCVAHCEWLRFKSAEKFCQSYNLRGYFAHGAPEKIMDLEDGFKAYLFRFGSIDVSERRLIGLITEDVQCS